MKESVFSPTAFAGKSVLITGGTSGIGYAAAEIFRAGGASVALMGRDAARGAAACARLGGGARAIYRAGDVRSAQDCRDVAETTAPSPRRGHSRLRQAEQVAQPAGTIRIEQDRVGPGRCRRTTEGRLRT